ncbi:MAG TPA: hypothetical protein VJ600_07580 [Holophagaceae bacterium]|nr:hypothetical protein [Holophagaceae bacterium]
MGFLDKLLRRAPADLPALEPLLAARDLVPTAKLEALRHAFDHLFDAKAREGWVEAVADLKAQGLSLPPPFDEALDELLPEVVPAWRAEREGRFARLLSEGLRIRIAFQGVAIPAAWLKIWDIEPEDLLDRSLDNLRRRTPAKPFERLPSGIYRGPWRDGLDAARILLPEVWRDLMKDQKPFMAVPNASTMLIAPQVLLPKLVEAVGPELRGQILQAAMMERVEEQWLPARLQDPHPMSGPQRELRLMDLLQALRAQEADLDPALGKPAPVTFLSLKDQKPMLMANWVAGNPCLLPEVDLIGFYTSDGAPLGVYWRQTLPRISELRPEPVEIWGPRRQRFATFPTGEQRERLERFANAEQMIQILKGMGLGKPAAPPAPPPPGQGAAPVPAHLQGQLGVQQAD